ncbi:MAG: zinc ribbon domain-containing protein [Ruminococcus sp.]|nr:zinc ribbon domain-containing protein [Ruminococcus sp.]
MKCPICGADNDNNVNYCNSCGTVLNDSTSGFMDGIDTSNLDLDSQFANSGFGKKNQNGAAPPPTVEPVSQTAQPMPQQPTPQLQRPQQQTPQMSNDPYATNNYGGNQGVYGGYQQPQYQQNYGQQQAFNQQATGFAQNNAAFNNAAKGFVNPAYNGFEPGRAGSGAVIRKKSNTGVAIAIAILIVVIGVFIFMALKYSKKASQETTVKMRCMTVTLPASMEKDTSFDETEFLGRYDPSVMNVVTEFYEDSDDSAFIYMKISYPTLTSSDLSGMNADMFMNLWVQTMRRNDPSFKDVSKATDEDNCKNRCITDYDGKRAFIYSACRFENNSFYFTMFLCHEEDRSTYESKFEKWDRSIKITD